MKKIILLLVVLFISSFSFAQTQYWVNASSGSDSFDGSCPVHGAAGCTGSTNGPWQTFAKANTSGALGGSGTLIHFADGTYVGNTSTSCGSLGQCSFSISFGGTSPSQLRIFQCDNGLYGAGGQPGTPGHCLLRESSDAANPQIVGITNSNYLLLQGFDIGGDGSHPATLVQAGVLFYAKDGTANFDQFDWNFLHDLMHDANDGNGSGNGCPSEGALGIDMGFPATAGRIPTGMKFIGNWVNNVGDTSNTTCNQTHALYIGAGPNVTVMLNIAGNAPGSGIKLYASNCGSVVTNNITYHNGWWGTLVDSSGQSRNDGCLGLGISPGKSTINNNISINDSFNENCGPLALGDGSANFFKNNLLIGTPAGQNVPVNSCSTTAVGSPSTVSGNLNTSNSGATAANTLVSYSDSGVGDFHLKSGSVAIGAGVNSCFPGGLTPCTSTNDRSNVPFGTIPIGPYAFGLTLGVSPLTLTYTGLTVGTPSSTQTVTLTNLSSTTSITLVSKVVTAGFSIVGSDCGASIAASGNCHIPISALITSSGTITGALTINSSATNNPQVVNLTASGGQSTVVVNPPSMKFAPTTVGGSGTSLLGFSDPFTSGTLNTSNWAKDSGSAPGNIPGINVGTLDPANIDLTGGSLKLSVQQTTTGNTYTTVFPGTENPLSEGGHWINGLTTALDWTDVRTTPNFAFPTQSGTGTGDAMFSDSIAFQTGTWGPNQQAQATIKIVTPITVPPGPCYQESEIFLHGTMSAHHVTGYEVNVGDRADTHSYINIVRWNGALADFTTLLSVQGSQYAVHTGDVWMAKIVGNVITAYINGVQKATVTDSTWTTGVPGIGFYLQAPATCGSGDTNFGYSSFTATDSINTAVNSNGAELRSLFNMGYGTYTFDMRAASTSSTLAEAGSAVSGQISSGFTYLNLPVPSATEIDFPEIEGQTPNIAEWTNYVGAGNQQASTNPVTTPDQLVHNYEMTWSPGQVIYGIDSTQLSVHNLNVPIMPAPMLFNLWGTNSTGFGGLATLNIQRNMFVQNFSYTPLSNRVYVYNNGSAPLTFNSVPAVSGDYTKSGDTCPVSPTTLAAGAGCQMDIHFAPTVFGTRTGSLTINTNAAGGVVTIPLSGVGTGTPINPPTGFVIQQAVLQN